jgi:phosphate starvation-inducible PhoH-like protein
LKSPETTLAKVAPFKREAEKPTSQDTALAFDDNRLASLVFGQYDQNLARVERRLGVSMHVNGNQVVIRGAREACEQARRVLQTLYARARLGQTADEGDVEGALEESAYQKTLFPSETEAAAEAFGELRTRRRGVVRARNAAQDKYLRALRQNELVFAEGPAGTGKTWLAVGHAVRCWSRAPSSASCCRVPPSRPASGWAFCPAT